MILRRTKLYGAPSVRRKRTENLPLDKQRCVLFLSSQKQVFAADEKIAHIERLKAPSLLRAADSLAGDIVCAYSLIKSCPFCCPAK